MNYKSDGNTIEGVVFIIVWALILLGIVFLGEKL